MSICQKQSVKICIFLGLSILKLTFIFNTIVYLLEFIYFYSLGGIKVLVAGPWYSSEASHYSITFDGVAVPTELVQNGLLRCFSPKHEPGFVTLAVAHNNVVISNSEIFEYRAHAEQISQQTTPDYFSFDGKVVQLFITFKIKIIILFYNRKPLSYDTSGAM